MNSPIPPVDTIPAFGADDSLPVSGLISYQRRRSARTIAITLVLLDILTFVSVAVSTGKPRILLILGLFMFLGAGATWAVLAERVQTGVFLLIGLNLAKHVLVVIGMRDISILPLFACVMVMLAAATLGSRRIVWVLAMSLVTIGIEFWLGVHYGGTRMALLAAGLGGVVLTVAAAVISILHVGQTEHAFALAAERDRMLQAAMLKAQESESRHRLIADGTDDLIALVDQAGKAEYLSSSFQRCLGLGTGEMADGALRAAVPVDEIPALLDTLRKARENGQATTQLRFGTAGRDASTYEIRVTRVVREQRELLAVIGRDVTLRLELEDRIRKAQRMEALDRLARGIAHDFNNLLSVIVGATDMIGFSAAPPKEIQKDLDIIRQALKSARGLTRQLLLFSRNQVAAVEIIDAGEAVRSLRELVGRLLGDRSTLDLEVDDTPLPIQLPQSQLEQVVMNFAANARDAMPQGGRLAVSVRHRRIERNEVGDLQPGNYVEIAAADTGTGIPADILPHLFEPFFTTKPASRGTGLGLATSFGIARQAGGTIVVETRVGHGSTFRAYFPLSAAEPAPRTATPTGTAPGHRVLLVDDNPEIIAVSARMLESAGFAVTSARSLADAEAALRDPSRSFEILVTDLMVGVGRGTALVPLARSLRPAIRIVLMSGYAPDPEAANTLLSPATTFLAKPFDRAALLHAVGGLPPTGTA